MLKRLIKKNNASRDVRFLDAECYRTGYGSLASSSTQGLVKARHESFVYSGLAKSVSRINLSNNHCADNDPSSISLFRASCGEPLGSTTEAEIDHPIYVDQTSDIVYKHEAKTFNSQPNGIEHNRSFSLSFLDPVEGLGVKNTQSPVESCQEHLVGKTLNQKGLGVFSDSKMYSALIQKELSCYCLDIRHFNHPRTFSEARYPLFDGISAWILFLSDDCDESFIEQFVDRYCDKPTLFLCPKMTRKNATQEIQEFITRYHLEKQGEQTSSEYEFH